MYQEKKIKKLTFRYLQILIGSTTILRETTTFYAQVNHREGVLGVAIDTIPEHFLKIREEPINYKAISVQALSRA